MTEEALAERPTQGVIRYFVQIKTDLVFDRWYTIAEVDDLELAEKMAEIAVTGQRNSPQGYVVQSRAATFDPSRWDSDFPRDLRSQ